jgi:hypothetical protein
MRSVTELYERSLATLPDWALMCVLTDCFSPQELMRIMNRIAAPRPGFRAVSIPAVDTVLNALDLYMDDPSAAHVMIAALNRNTDPLRKEIAGIEAGELSSHYPLKAIRSMMQHFTIGKFVWALLRDERPEADALLKRILPRIRKGPWKMKPSRTHAKAPRKTQGGHAAILPAGEEFEKKVKESKEFLDEVAGEYRTLYHQAKRVEEKEARAHEEIKSARRMLDEALREKNILSGKCRELEGRVHALESQPALGADIEQKMKRTAKEKEKLEYEIAKMRRERESEIQQLRALEQKVRDARAEKDELESKLREVRQREASLVQKVGAIEKELGSLRARAHTVPKQEAQKKREYWEQRVGVFVDGLTCYASARALYGRKIDYRSLLAKVLDMRIRSTSIIYLLETDFARLENLRQALRAQGFLVKPMKIKWENEVMADIMSNIDRLDTVVTCTGRRPSPRFSETLEKTGKRIEYWAFEGEEGLPEEDGASDVVYFGQEVLLS